MTNLNEIGPLSSDASHDASDHALTLSAVTSVEDDDTCEGNGVSCAELADMILSDDATNRVSKRKNTTDCTRLVSIKGVTIKDINAQLLCTFTSHLAMPTK